MATSCDDVRTFTFLSIYIWLCARPRVNVVIDGRNGNTFFFRNFFDISIF